MEDFLSTTIDTSNKDEDLSIATKNWNRLVTSASTVGYKEGLEDGQESVFQEGFDKGYEDAFNIAFTIGKYKGMVSSIQRNVQIPSNINDILNESRKGVCYICNEESQEKNLDNFIEDMPFADIQKQQKKHSTNVIETLNKYFEPILADCNHELACDT